MMTPDQIEDCLNSISEELGELKKGKGMRALRVAGIDSGLKALKELNENLRKRCGQTEEHVVVLEERMSHECTFCSSPATHARLKALEEKVDTLNSVVVRGKRRVDLLKEQNEEIWAYHEVGHPHFHEAGDVEDYEEKPPTCGECAEFDDDGCVDYGVRDKNGPPKAFSCFKPQERKRTCGECAGHGGAETCRIEGWRVACDRFRPKEQKADKCNCPTANVNKQEAKPPTGGECMDNVDELEERADAGDDLRKRIGWLEDRLEEHTMKLHLKPPTCGQCGYSTPEGLGCTVPGCVNKSRFKPKESKEEKCNCWNGNVNKQEGKLTNWGGGDEWVLSPGPGMLPQWVITHCPWCGKKL